MDPGDVAPELAELTSLEVLLIARMHPALRVYKI